MVLAQQGIHLKKILNKSAYLTLFKRISSKYTENLNLNPLVLKLLEGEKGKHFTHRHR